MNDTYIDDAKCAIEYDDLARKMKAFLIDVLNDIGREGTDGFVSDPPKFKEGLRRLKEVRSKLNERCASSLKRSAFVKENDDSISKNILKLDNIIREPRFRW